MDRWQTIIEPFRIHQPRIPPARYSSTASAWPVRDRGFPMAAQPRQLRHFTATFAPLG